MEKSVREDVYGQFEYNNIPDMMVGTPSPSTSETGDRIFKTSVLLTCLRPPHRAEYQERSIWAG